MPEQAKIPEYLGKCDIIHVHDDGDLTIKCGGKKFVVTAEGEVFKEYTLEQCFDDELEKLLAKKEGMSKEEMREIYTKALTKCAGAKL